MSEQSLQNIDHEVPKFTEIEAADWGRDVVPTEPVVQDKAETEVSSETESAPAEVDGTAELARGRGWVPKEDWKGPEERWVDARSFNERYEQVLPVVQRENKKVNAELKQTQAELAELRKQAAQWQTIQAEQEKSQRQLRLDTLKMERKSAIENQDYDTLIRVDDELLDLKVADRTAPPRSTAPQADPAVQRTLGEFVQDNPVFKDPKMGQVLAEQATLMRSSGSVLVGREFLDEAKERVERLYPERFRSLPRRTHPMAETGGAPGGSRSAAGKVWSDLKPEWRDANERFIKTTPGITREDIVKNAPPEAFRS